MKKALKTFLLINLLAFYSCEEVVDVALNESEPRLIVEASVFLDKENPSPTQFIRLTTTAPFFDNQIPPATDAEVLVYDEDGNEFRFFEIDPGIYRTQSFIPEFNTTYFLEITYEGETYTAQEILMAAPELEFAEQNDTGGFSGEDIELKVYYTDFPEPGNFYLLKFIHSDLSLQIYDDEFINGNRTFGFFTDEELSAGEQVEFEIQGISRNFYEYMFILRSQAGTAGGPFQTQPTTVRGNLINSTNPDNFALGYFRLSERDNLTYTIN